VFTAFGARAVFLHAASPGEMAWAPLLERTPWASIVVEHAPTHFPMSHALLNRVYFIIKSRASSWISVSRHGARHLEGLARLPQGAIASLLAGVAEPADDPPENRELMERVESGSAIVGFGDATSEKGFDIFADLARHADPDLRQAAWTWIGTPDRRDEGRLACFPRQSTVGWILRRSKIVTIPSRHEGVPLLLLESLAAGSAIVASRAGGIPEPIGDSSAALLVAPEDRVTWLNSLARLWSDEGLRFRLRSRARELWERNYTRQSMAERWEAVLRGLVCPT
jgi:glycosyltransferase involved in cell wall biosynthesis